MLTLLESEPPDEDSNFHFPEYTLNQIVAECLGMIEFATGRAPLSLHDLEQQTPAAQREILHRLLSESALLPSGANLNDLQGFLQTIGTGLRIRYTPHGVYPGALHLVSANILGNCQQELSIRFSRDSSKRFTDVPWYPGRMGVPLFFDVAAHFECQVAQMWVVGDHFIYFGKSSTRKFQ